MKLVYYDTCVWITYILGFGYRKRLAKEFINDLKTGENICIVSDLVQMESIDAIRYTILRNEAVQPLDDAKKKELINKIESKIKELADLISQLVDQRKIAFKNYNGSVITINKYIHSLLKQNFGDIVIRNDQYKYNGVGHCDYHHAITAKDYYAELCTLDHGFEQLKDSPDFESLTIKIKK